MFVLYEQGVYYVRDLWKAVKRKNVGKVQEILDTGVSPNSKLRGGGSYPIFVFLKDPRLIQVFIGAGVNVNIGDNYGWTILHYLSRAKGDNRKAMSTVIENGGNVNIRDHYNNTPLHHAVEFNRLDNVKFLIDNEARLDIGENGKKVRFGEYRSVLHTAVKEDNTEIAAFLIKSGSNPYCRDSSGIRPVCYARSKGMIDVFTKADYSFTNKDIKQLESHGDSSLVSYIKPPSEESKE